ncbi:hypothetical protein PFISCL1PPCAC_26023, partial [Pristionchus fissidentatus]
LFTALKEAKSAPKDAEMEIFIVNVEEAAAPEESSRLSYCILLKAAAFCTLCICFSFVLIHCLVTERETIQDEFDRFVKKFGKTYETELQLEEAYDNFRINLWELSLERKKQPDVEFDVHEWMDVPSENIREKFFLGDESLPKLEGIARFEGFEESVNRPAEHSWRSKATPAKNQGSCGSCWAFATVAAVETANAIAGNPLIGLSEQEMIECDTRNSGCRGGVRSYAMSFVVQTGLVPDSSYPYTGKEGEQCHIGNATRVHIKDFRLLSQSEDAMADWLFKTGPITFGMNVTKSLYAYRSGVFRPTEADCQTKSDGSHAVTLMGYGSERGQDYWLVKNSWGDYWGDSGYFKLARGANVCGMANNVVAPMF